MVYVVCSLLRVGYTCSGGGNDISFMIFFILPSRLDAILAWASEAGAGFFTMGSSDQAHMVPYQCCQLRPSVGRGKEGVLHQPLYDLGRLLSLHRSQ